MNKVIRIHNMLQIKRMALAPPLDLPFKSTYLNLSTDTDYLRELMKTTDNMSITSFQLIFENNL
jgi:hypothetical protein